MSDHPLTVAQIREKRFRRDASRYSSEADRHAWEMHEIKAEYRKVSETYIKHLERLDKKAARVLAAQKNTTESLIRHIDQHENS